MRTYKKFQLHLIWLMIFLTLSPIAFAQNVEFSRSAFPNQSAGFRQATRNLKTGEKLFLQGGGRNIESLTYLLKAHEFNPNNARLNYLIGQALLSTVQYPQAIEHLLRAHNLGLTDNELYFFLAGAYHLNKDFNKAIEYYALYRQQLGPQELSQRRSLIDRKMAQCKSGLLLLARPERVFIDNIGSNLNSAFDDYNPRIFPSGAQMFFTSRRPLQEKARTDRTDFKYFENILIAELAEGGWQLSGHAGPTLNRHNHSSVAGMAPDGYTLIIYNGSKGGDLFISDFSKGKWTKPIRFRNGINSRHKETNAALKAGRDSLYFISDRPGGYGGKDIWFTNKDHRGGWREPINLGHALNTELDEEALYLSPDGKTLYFSSQGHNSMGGGDIFRSTFEAGRWTEPHNLGYPINSPSDDLFYMPHPDGRSAYFSTFRAGGNGASDIYRVTFMGPEKPVINQMHSEPIVSRARPDMLRFIDPSTQLPSSLVILRGKVFDNTTGQPLKANIEIFDKKKDELLAAFSTSAETGAYLITMPSGKSLQIAVQAEGYMFLTENISIDTTNTATEIVNDFRLRPLEVGTTIVLRNIFFDTGSANLRPESYAELGVLYKLLIENPRLKIEISGHTDNVGSAALNQRLSHDRARAVVTFLAGRGISADRLSYKGYGFSKPVATNNTPEGRQLNRRTEFEIMDY